MRICMLIDAWFPLHGGGQVHVFELTKRLISDYGFEVDIFTRKLRITPALWVCPSGRKARSDRPGSYELRVENKLSASSFQLPASRSKETGVNKNQIFYPPEDTLQFVENDGLRVFLLGPDGRFENVFFRIWWMFWVVVRALWENRKKKYDLIHAHAFLAGIPGKLLSMLLRIPVIYTIHGTSMSLGRTGFMSFVERFLLTKIQYTQEISVSHSFLQFPNVNKYIEVIPNGVDVGKFKITSYELRVTSSILDKNSQKTSHKRLFKLLYVGRFDKIKGVHILIDAIRILLNDHPNLFKERKFCLNLVGFGFEEDNLKKLVSQLGLNEIIKFEGKKIGEGLIRKYLSANLFVLPSLSEGQPLTLLEAWAAKLPVLVTDVGDNALYVKDGVNGFLVKSNDPYSLSAGIKNALFRKDLKKIGENGYKLVEREFSWGKMAEKVVTVYKNALINSKFKYQNSKWN